MSHLKECRGRQPQSRRVGALTSHSGPLLEGRLNVLSIPETPATGGRRPERRRPEESGVRPSPRSGVLAGSPAPGCLGPAAPHGGGRPLGRRPGLPSGVGSAPRLSS